METFNDILDQKETKKIYTKNKIFFIFLMDIFRKKWTFFRHFKMSTREANLFLYIPAGVQKIISPEGLNNCLSEAVLALVIQCLIGTFVDAVMVGCIFIKLSKPTNRTDTLIFSTDAVISQVEIFPKKTIFKNFSATENTASCFELEICEVR